MKSGILPFLFAVLLTATLPAKAKNYNLRSYGLKANTTSNSAPILADAVRKIVAGHQDDTPIVLRFTKGEYHFYPTPELEREYYISN
ncbi:MAG: alpha-1,3-galactosidase B, partial [Odoribacter sp.]|nr:alpha-1,3-galactosidase B [Odoribacter sp.]